MAKYCRYCGSPVREGANFCKTCGRSLAKAAAQQPSAQAAPSAPKSGQQASWQEQYERLHAQNRIPTARNSASGTPPAASRSVPHQQGRQTVRQTARGVADQAAQPLRQAIGSVSGMGNTFSALPNPGEITLSLPGVSAATGAVKGRGLPGFVKFLISIAAGGGSIPLLHRLGFPWSLFAGLGIAVLLIVISSVVRKSTGGGK